MSEASDRQAHIAERAEEHGSGPVPIASIHDVDVPDGETVTVAEFMLAPGAYISTLVTRFDGANLVEIHAAADPIMPQQGGQINNPDWWFGSTGTSATDPVVVGDGNGYSQSFYLEEETTFTITATSAGGGKVLLYNPGILRIF